MKKILMVLLDAMVVFGFTACNNNGNGPAVVEDATEYVEVLTTGTLGSKNVSDLIETGATITADAAPVQKGIIENYDSPESVQNTRWALATYMGDFKGEQGVIRYDLTGDMWPGYQMNYSLQR